MNSRLQRLIPARMLRARERQKVQREGKGLGVGVRYATDFIEVSKAGRVIRLHYDQEVYLRDFLLTFDYYFGAVQTIEQTDRKLADFSTPRFHKVIGFEDFAVLFPSIPEPFVTLDQYLSFADLKRGDVVLDLGLYAGLTSIMFSRAVGPEGAVFGFEPDSRNFAVALENLKTARQFGLPMNLTMVPKAVWRDDDGLEFSTEAAMGSSATSIVGTGRGTVTKVPTTTLASFCREQGLDRVDFIKMDIEGAEIPVLESSRDLLSRLKPRIIIEPHDVRGVMTTGGCCEVLARAGYRTRVVEQHGLSIPLIEAVAQE